MSSVSAYSVVGHELFDLTRRLGQLDWFSFWLCSNDGPITEFELHLDKEGFSRIELAYVQSCISEPFLIYSLYAKSKWLSGGPKILRPDEVQCTALQNVDLTIGFEEYKQPFPTVLIELPDTFRRSLSAQIGLAVPRFVLLCHCTENGFIIAIEIGDPDGEERAAILPPCWPSLQAGLDHLLSETGGPCGKRVRVLASIAMNFGLLLTHYGAKNLGPLDPKAHQIQLQNSKRKKGQRSERAKRLLQGTLEQIDFAQHVILSRSSSTPTRANGKSSCKKPHWRRGHYRRQLVGAGRSASKLLFIKPIFINAGMYSGDLSDTSYILQLQ